MIGKRKHQRELFDVGNVYPLELAPNSFHGQLAKAARGLFSDEQFAGLYHERLGRPSVPPSLLALLTLLQHESGVSDHEAVDRSGYDLRWAAVLGVAAGEPLCAKSTLQEFRAQCILHQQVRLFLATSVKEAKRAGLLKGQALKIALDTRPIEGRGAVLDTYNLLAAGIRHVAGVLARAAKQELDAWLTANGLIRFTHSSIKGSVALDWSDRGAKERFLSEIVADGRRVLALAAGTEAAGSEAALLLERLLLQDIERVDPAGDGPQDRMKQGTTADRMPSISDPEQRHGHKSASKRFNGHKASVACDTQSQIIVGVDVIPGNASDATDALALAEQAETITEASVVQVIGDCAYGGGETRQEFANAGRDLVVRVPKAARGDGLYPKSEFTIDIANNRVSCPGGNTTDKHYLDGNRNRVFTFGAACASCPLKDACTRSPAGRTVRVHPQEQLLAAARERQRTAEGKVALRSRVVIEHRLARLAQLGIGQARYIGRAKVRFQLTVAAAIANLRRSWNWEANCAC